MNRNTLGVTNENVNVGAVLIKTNQPSDEYKVVKIYKRESKGVKIENMTNQETLTVSWFDLCVKYRFSGSKSVQNWMKHLIQDKGHTATMPFLGNRMAIIEEQSKLFGVKLIPNSDDKQPIDPGQSISMLNWTNQPEFIADDVE